MKMAAALSLGVLVATGEEEDYFTAEKRRTKTATAVAAAAA